MAVHASMENMKTEDPRSVTVNILQVQGGGQDKPASPEQEQQQEEEAAVAFAVAAGAKRWRSVAGVVASGATVAVGTATNVIAVRYYFVHGGTHLWLAAWLQVAGWPAVAAAAAVAGAAAARRGRSWLATSMLPRGPRASVLCCWYAGLGVMLAFTNALFAWGSSLLPASTSALLMSTQLAFNALFSAAASRSRMSAYTVNAVVLLLLSAAVLLCQGHETRTVSVKGVIATLTGAVLNGSLMPLMEATCNQINGEGKGKGKGVRAVMEMQVAVCAAASAVAVVGVVVELRERGLCVSLRTEAAAFEGGVAAYAVTLAAVAVSSQVLFVGSVALIRQTSALVSGVYSALLLPLTGLLAAPVFSDSVSPLKGMSVALAIWGFASYAYGALAIIHQAP